MARISTAERSKPLNATDQHRGWLELVDTDGPFLAIPPLKRVWPQGMPALADARKTALMDARKDFEGAWEKLDREPDDDRALDEYRIVRDKWVETVLCDVAGWAESLSWGDVAGVEAHSPNRAVTIRAQAALSGVDGPGAIVHVIDPVESLRQTPGDLWAASPVDRLEVMLRESKVPIGLVTDGRWWGLVCAREGAMAASGVVDGLTWIEEPRTRDAFFAVIGRQHLIGGDPAERLPVLFEESVAAAEEITEALGAQVRRAVELLVQSFSESAADDRRRGLPDSLPTRTHDSYEAAVTVMMRAVFLLFAEERGLLPSGELFEQGYGIAQELDRLIARESEESEEALDATSLTWHRLLATSQALYRGASFENLRMPAYGGSLFDPSRFPFLTAVNEQGTLAVSVPDRVMLHVLRSVQVADIKGEARRISFRDVDVEQIGYIYEGLLGYTASVADEVVVGLRGTLGSEPEIPLATLEALAAVNADSKKLAAAIRGFVEVDQPSAKPASVVAIAKAVTAAVDPSTVSALTQAVGDDLGLRDRVEPWLGLIRLDLRRRPFVVLTGGLLVTETPSRKNAGAHYTPKALAEEVVLHALQPLCYLPGPHQTADESAWQLKSSNELLDLKVADIACGSGAFLVAAARYLSERVVEAWMEEDPDNVSRKDLFRRAIRQVVSNCLYGADINDMAVEMCKLALWLVSLDRDLPFSFVDDKVLLGNSLLGLTALRQLRQLHVDPELARTDETFLGQLIDVDLILENAVRLRSGLSSEIDELDPSRSGAAKRRQLRELKHVTAGLTLLADGVVAAALPYGGRPGKGLDDGIESLRVAARNAFPDQGLGNFTLLESIVERGLQPTVPTDYLRWRPLHWPIAVPDVVVRRGGFDSVIGNPPFLGGLKITGAMGSNVRDWLVERLAGGRKGAADLVAYFFLRAVELLREGGTTGLIATNTLAQGDTREVGLDRISDQGFEIYRAIQSSRWPSTQLDLRFAAVWGIKGGLPSGINRWCDGVDCVRISTLLEPAGQHQGLPKRLLENANLSFVGCVPLGSGFLLEPELAEKFINSDPRNIEVIRPYFTGEDLNGSPTLTPSRWIIDFNERSIESAKQFLLPFSRIEEMVKPERAKNKRPARRDRWWKYGENASGLRGGTQNLERVICFRQTSATLMPIFVDSRMIFDQTMTVIADDTSSMLAILSSSVHSSWVLQRGVLSPAGVPRYTPSDVFETFPRPHPTPRLAAAGERLSMRRHEIMVRRGLGLTNLYNLVNNPDPSNQTDDDIEELRSIHIEIDLALMEAFGWDDLELNHDFYTYRRVTRWTVAPPARVQVLDRLLLLNHSRFADQKGRAPMKRKSRLQDGARGQDVLFHQ